MYSILMNNKLEIFKKKLIYRAGYRGTKEMDILLSSFVNKYINTFDESLLLELEKFLNFEDEVILDYYQKDTIKKKIEKNKVSKIFKNFKL
jgi:antitoxin CptB